MSLVEQRAGNEKKPSLIAQAAALVAVTVVAVGMGWFAGSRLEAEPPAEADAEPGTFRPQPRQAENVPVDEMAARTSVVVLDPITTNLADPKQVWVRMELSAVFDGDTDLGLAQAVHQDLLAYLRTVQLKQIESASGFQHLKADLRERARVLSGGRVTDILIQTFLYE